MKHPAKNALLARSPVIHFLLTKTPVHTVKIFSCLLAGTFLLFSIPLCPAKGWIEYTGCWLTPGAYRDGDSFSGRV